MNTPVLTSFLSGALHPVFGLDHILAMVVVGVWALQIGGRSLWAVPFGFVGTMAIGFIVARIGIPLPFVEPFIIASSIILGAFVLLALRLPSLFCIALAGLFGLFHGYAHGAELGDAMPLAFGVGFVLVTAGLHAFGILLATYLTRAHKFAPRALGGLSSLIGLSFLFG